MKKYRIFSVVSACAAMIAGAATDGTLLDYTGMNNTTADSYRWYNGIKAADGGIMYVDGMYSSPSHMVSLEADVTLGGIVPLNDGLVSFGSKERTVTLSGDNPVIRVSLPYLQKEESVSHATFSSERRPALMLVKLQGTGNNTLVKDGGGKFHIEHPITGFKEIYVRDGGLTATNSGGVAITALPVRLSGFLGYQSDYLASSGDYAASCAAGGVTAEAGAQISVNKVNAGSAALTVGEIKRAEFGSLLIRSSRGTASARSLGETEKVLTTGEVPMNEKGLVAPWIAAREVAEPGTPVHFLGYDSEKGFVPYAGYLQTFSSATGDDMVRISSATELSSDAEAAAVEVDNASDLTLNARLTLGAGGNPGAIALNSSGTSDQTFSGTGSIDFGDRQGLVWRGAEGGVLKFNVPISGSAGVTFTSGGTADSGSEKPSENYYVKKPVFEIADGVCANLSGGVHLANAGYRFYRGSFGANEVYLDGGDRYGQAVMMYYDYASGSITNHFHVRGDYAFNITGAKAGKGWDFDAPLTLTGETLLNSYSKFFRFNGPIGGKGDLTLYTSNAQGSLNSEFNAVNTYLGKTSIIAGNVHQIGPAGTFGDGPVAVDDQSMVVFNRCGGYSMTNDYECLGATELRRSALDMLGKTSVGEIMAGTDTQLGIGSDVSFGCATLRSMTVKPAVENARLEIGDDTSVAATFADVPGKSLEIVKTGSGEAVFFTPAAGKSTAHGVLKIDGGSVKLDANPLNSPACTFWLDASDDECLTIDDEGKITAWHSKGELEYDFVPEGAPNNMTVLLSADGEINSLRAVNCDGTGRPWYKGSSEIRFSTLFIVHRPGENADIASLFGMAGVDCGVRVKKLDDGTYGWYNKLGNASYSGDCPYVYIDGVRTNSFTPGETQILALRIPKDAENNVWGTPVFPGYGTAHYKGDIAEIIAFDRELTESEFVFVNNYLSGKWLGGEVLDEVKDDLQIIPEGMELEILSDSVLDLNGLSQTVAALSGKGRIVNSSDTPATLTVAGSFDGALDVGEGVNIVHNGEAVYKIYNEGPVTDGLAYWLDASRADTVLCDDEGAVTNWLSRAGSVGKFLNDGTKTDQKVNLVNVDLTCPVYVSEDPNLGGRPSVAFTNHTDSLWSSAAANIRTVFILKYDSTQAWTKGGNPYTWGMCGGGYLGLMLSSANNVDEALGYPAEHPRAFVQSDDRFRVTTVNGVIDSVQSGGMITVGGIVGSAYVVSAVIDEFNSLWTTESNTFLGAWENTNGGRYQAIGEVLAYDRALSDGEMMAVEKYLVDKWIAAEGIPEESDCVELSGTVTVAVNADGSVNPLVIEGPLDASGAELEVVGSKNARDGANRTLVETESIREPFAALKADSDKFRIWSDGCLYYGCYPCGLTILFK